MDRLLKLIEAWLFKFLGIFLGVRFRGTCQELMLWTVSVLCAFTLAGAEINEWDYSRKNGPSEWLKKFPQCGSSLQSPVHIETSRVWHSNSLVAFEMVGYETIPPHAHWGMVNTGNSLQVDLAGAYVLQEGALEGQYRAVQFHFHWGSDDQHGAEHVLDDYVAPMELHIVHYNTRYSSPEEASMQPDGVAMLAFLFNVSQRDNPGYLHLLNHLANVTHPGDRVTIRPLPLLSLLPANLNNYYRYQGSDTAPPCAETVSWSVFVNYIDISRKQLDMIRKSLKMNARGELERPLVDNYRPLQAMNERTVYSSHPDHATVLTSPFSFPMSITMAVFFGLLLIIVVMK